MNKDARLQVTEAGHDPVVDADDTGLAMLLPAQKQSLEMVVRGAPLPEVLKFLTGIVERHAGGQVVAAILLLDEDGRLRTGAGPSLPDDYNRAIDGLKASIDLGTCSVAAVTGRVVITPDIAADPKWATIKELPLGLGLVAAWSQPILARDGRVLGTFGTYFRVRRGPTTFERQLVETVAHTAALAIERAESDRSMERQRRLLGMAMDAARMGEWQYNIAGGICEYSPRAQALYSLPARVDHDAEVNSFIHPDDIPSMWEAVRAAIEPGGSGRYEVEYRVRCGDGWRWLSVCGLTESAGEGPERRAVAITGASRDITERKEAERQHQLLVDELSHRVKNTLAVVQSIAAQTLRRTPDPREFHGAFTARVSALARAHSLLTRALWKGAPLADLVDTAISPFRSDGRDDGVICDGPDVVITPNAALTLSLVIHELGTNALSTGRCGSLTAACR